MSLTRKMLKAMSIDEEKIEQIIEAHTESLDAVKADRDAYKQDAQKLSAVQKELDALKANNGDDYKEKYEKEHKAFEDFKAEQTAKETKAAKSRAYRDLLKSANIDERRYDGILKLTDLDGIELNADGKIKDADKHAETIKTEWADFVVSTQTTGTKTQNPPANKPSSTKWTKEEIMKIKDTTERQKAWCEMIEQERNN